MSTSISWSSDDAPKARSGDSGGSSTQLRNPFKRLGEVVHNRVDLAKHVAKKEEAEVAKVVKEAEKAARVTKKVAEQAA